MQSPLGGSYLSLGIGASFWWKNAVPIGDINQLWIMEKTLESENLFTGS